MTRFAASARVSQSVLQTCRSGRGGRCPPRLTARGRCRGWVSALGAPCVTSYRMPNSRPQGTTRITPCRDALISRQVLVDKYIDSCHVRGVCRPNTGVPFRRSQRNATVTRYCLSLCDAVGARGSVTLASRLVVRHGHVGAGRCGRYGLSHCAHQLTRHDAGADLAHETSATEWRASKRYHAKFCLPLMIVPSIQRRRPTDTMSEHDGMKGAACLVEAKSVSSSSHVGGVRAKC